MGDRIKNSRVRFLVDLAYWAAILALIVLVIKYLLKRMMPIFLAFVFAAVCRPLSRWLSKETKTVRNAQGERVQVPRKIRLHKNVAGILSVAVLFLVVGGIVTLIAFRLADQISDWLAVVPSLYEDYAIPALNNVSDRVLQFTNRFDSDTMDTVEAAIPNLISAVGSAVTGISKQLLSWVTGFASNLPSSVLNTIICLIATVFFAIDFDSIRTFIYNNLPHKTVKMIINIKDSFVDIIWQFLKSYFIIFCITTLEITLGLLIVGIKHPLMFGVLVGIFDAFPIVGSGMVMLPWALITLFSGQIGQGIGLLIVYAVVVIARQIIEPKIVGKRVGLRPIVTLTCMYAGTRIIGGIGLFALPIAVSIIADLNDTGVIHIFRRNSDVSPQPEGENENDD